MLLIPILMISLSSLSQIDTTKMTFPTKTIRLISKELVQKDGLVKENKILYNNIFLLESKISDKDSIIITQDKIIFNDSIQKNELVFQKNSQIVLNDVLKKELKKSNNQTLFYKITTGASLLLSLLLVVK